MNFKTIVTIQEITVKDIVDFGSEQMWLFQHLPKTAGTSLRFELNTRLSPNYSIEMDYDPAITTPYEKRMDISVAKFLDSAKQNQYRFVSGHLRLHHVEEIKKLHSPAMFTFLREPVSRVVSAYKYLRTPKDPRYKEFREKHPTIRTFAEEGPNMMSNRLAGPGLKPDEGYQKVIDDYLFIGTQDDYDFWFSTLMSFIGFDAKAKSSHRNPKDKSEDQPLITDDDLKYVAECNHRDVLLYQSISNDLSILKKRLIAND